MTSGKDVILVAIKKHGIDYVLDNLDELAENSLVTKRYAMRIVQQVACGQIKIKEGNHGNSKK